MEEREGEQRKERGRGERERDVDSHKIRKEGVVHVVSEDK